jgi:hypothetical protein
VRAMLAKGRGGTEPAQQEGGKTQSRPNCSCKSDLWHHRWLL